LTRSTAGHEPAADVIGVGFVPVVEDGGGLAPGVPGGVVVADVAVGVAEASERLGLAVTVVRSKTAAGQVEGLGRNDFCRRLGLLRVGSWR